MLTDDGPDGVDTAAWIGRQPWSNGKIGMIGTSYVGGTQHAMAMEEAPELVDRDPGRRHVELRLPEHAQRRRLRAAVLELDHVLQPAGAAGSRAIRARRTVLKEMMDNRQSYLANLPLRRGTTPLKLAPEYEDWLVEAMRHGANDEFWEQNNIIDFPERYKDIPVYLVGGWYDSWAGNTTANFMALTPRIKGPVYLIMGPVDSRAARPLGPRPGELRRRRGHPRPAGLAARVVRPLAQGHRQHGRQRGPVRHARCGSS